MFIVLLQERREVGHNILMLSKDFSRLIQQEGQQEETPEMQNLKTRLLNKSFWIWMSDKHKEQSNLRNINTHGDCCFNHIIGLPSKNGIQHPLYDYEKMLYKSLMEPSYLNSDIKALPRVDTMMEKEVRRKQQAEATYADFKCKHLFVKKATGIGATEFFLRFMVWLCLCNDDYRGAQMVIVVGPNQNLAIKMIQRIKALFQRHDIYFDSKETVVTINGCTIEAYPSNNLSAFRSLTNPKFILIDEADFFRKSEQEEVRHVSERYIAKSDPFIVLCSTPNAPNGLMQKIEQEPFETCIYKKIFLDFTILSANYTLKKKSRKLKCHHPSLENIN